MVLRSPAKNGEYSPSRTPPTNVTGAALSVLIGMALAIALFSHLILFLVPLAAVGITAGIRALKGTRGSARGLAWGGIFLNGSVTTVFLYFALRYLMD